MFCERYHNSVLFAKNLSYFVFPFCHRQKVLHSFGFQFELERLCWVLNAVQLGFTFVVHYDTAILHLLIEPVSSFLHRTDNPYSPSSQPTLFQSFENGKVLYDVNSPNLNSLTVINTPQLYRENLAGEFIALVDFTFLVNYRNATRVNHFVNTNNATGVPNYAFDLATENWHLRHEAYAAKASSAKDQVAQKFNFIPLFSNEQSSCVIFGLSSQFLGQWLGGNNGYNPYRRNEQAYYDQWSMAPAHCLDCNTETQLAAFGWYKYGCITSHGVFSDPNSLDPHRRIVCGSANVIPLNSEEANLRKETIEIYPNPVNTHLYVRLGSKGIYEYNILNLSGQRFKSGKVSTVSNYVDLTGLSSGVYHNLAAFKVIISDEN